MESDLSAIPQSMSQLEAVGPKELANFASVAVVVGGGLPPHDKSTAFISPCRKPDLTRGDETQINPWEKVVVTEEGIDNWRAQLFGHDIRNFPKTRPEGMQQELFNELKKKYVAPTRIRAKRQEKDDDDEATK